MTFLPHDRLARQVLHLESSVADIAGKMELIVEKLGLQEKAKGNERAGKLSVYSHESDETASDGSVLVCVDRSTRAELSSRRPAGHTNSTYDCHIPAQRNDYC
ncbi:hypothetical protein INR49_009659 [Caranx melampygus]|nr:hypothetical protein INR49_009659 [Caranx melampygus]